MSQGSTLSSVRVVLAWFLLAAVLELVSSVQHLQRSEQAFERVEVPAATSYLASCCSLACPVAA